MTCAVPTYSCDDDAPLVLGGRTSSLVLPAWERGGMPAAGICCEDARCVVDLATRCTACCARPVRQRTSRPCGTRRRRWPLWGASRGVRPRPLPCPCPRPRPPPAVSCRCVPIPALARSRALARVDDAPLPKCRCFVFNTPVRCARGAGDRTQRRSGSRGHEESGGTAKRCAPSGKERKAAALSRQPKAGRSGSPPPGPLRPVRGDPYLRARHCLPPCCLAALRALRAPAGR